MATLLRPLGPLGTIDWWQLSPVGAERYDVPDQPMSGGMDAAFFLATHKNFVPHEYPCRRVFAASHRDRRPEREPGFVQAEGAAGWWLPFGSDRVDLSGFWHRPTLVEARARTVIRLAEPGPLRLQLATCGAAMLWVDGREALWLAPCQRNLDHAAEASVALAVGEHALEVWFADLCERDTRWWFRVAVLGGPAVEVALPLPVTAERAEALIAVLEGLRFDRPAYDGGAVALHLDHPASRTLEAEIAVDGPFMSDAIRRFRATLAPGATSLPVADAGELPADFREHTVTLRDGPLALSRRLGTEAIGRTGRAPETLAARTQEALAHAAASRDAGPAAAVARLADGHAGPETDAIIAAALPAVADCWDCADFQLVPLLWARMRHGALLAPGLREELDRAILGFRYWLDEPGNDVMWFFSENHALLFHTAAYLAGTLFPDATFTRSGRSGDAQRQVARERLAGWFDHFAACEMAEWNSAPYFPIDLKGLCALFALAPDPEIRARSERAVRRLVEIVALAGHQGMITASQGRSYEHSLRAPRTLELSGLARLLWGCGRLSDQQQALPLLALALRDHGLVLPEALAEIALWQDPRELEWTFVQGEGRLAPLYHCKSRHWAMGSVAAYRHGGWGYQETVLHARIGEHPDTQLWINHPGERIVGGFGRPSFWGGSGTVPRVHQYRALAWARFDTHHETPDFTHAHVAEAAFDEVIAEECRVLLRSGDGLALIQASGPLQRITHGATAGLELRLDGRQGAWIVRLSDLAREGSLAGFGRRMAGLGALGGREDTVRIGDPDYGTVVADRVGTVAAEGRILDPAAWTVRGDARLSDGSLLPLPSHQDISA